MSTTYLEFSDKKSNKFWEITTEFNKTTVRYGKIGSNGVSLVKEHKDHITANLFSETEINGKLAKGYTNKSKSCQSTTVTGILFKYSTLKSTNLPKLGKRKLDYEISNDKSSSYYDDIYNILVKEREKQSIQQKKEADSYGW